MPPTPAGHDPSTRDRLVAAAYDLLIEDGVEAPTIQALARRAGLTNGAVYANFASRHELLREVALACWSHLPHAGLARLATGRDVPADDQPGTAEPEMDELIALLAEQQSTPPGPEHRLLAEVTSAAMRDPDTEHVLRTCLDLLRSTAAVSLSNSMLAGVVVDLYMGAITSKCLNRRQPSEEDMLAVLRGLIAPDRP
jgi:AcrR family transcriptional regulator